MASLHLAQELLDIIYPVGSIYMSTNNVNPQILFGGSWIRMTGAFMYACDGDTWGQSADTGPWTASSWGTTGSTALSISQMPWHSHSLQYAVIGSGGGVNYIYGIPYGGATSNGSVLYSSEHKYSGELRFGISGAGGGEGHTHSLNGHNHTIPYISVFVYRRYA